MGIVTEDDVSVVEVYRRTTKATAVDKFDFGVEVIKRVTDQETVAGNASVLEVYRTTKDNSRSINKKSEITQTVKNTGALANVGAGPDLPSNPYEGQIWIKT